ncbi:MAG: tetratricopeptide repeat protein [Flavobacteriales bacterium]
MERMEMDMMMIRVNACMSSGRYGEARELLERVIEAEPAHGVAHGMLGWICWALLDEHERAAVHFRCAVRWAPGYTNAWMHFLNLLASDGRAEELHEVYHRALIIPGIDRAAVHAIVARYLERTGRSDEALRLYRNARRVAVDPSAEAEYRASILRVRGRVRRERWTAWMF